MGNALIAYMGDSYNKVREVSEAWSLTQRAQLIQEFLGNINLESRGQMERSFQWLHILLVQTSKRTKLTTDDIINNIQTEVSTLRANQNRWFRNLEAMMKDMSAEVSSLKDDK